jgi:hypothetical protein
MIKAVINSFEADLAKGGGYEMVHVVRIGCTSTNSKISSHRHGAHTRDKH